MPVSVPMNILQCLASVPPEMIIWALNAIRWLSGSSTPVKVVWGEPLVGQLGLAPLQSIRQVVVDSYVIPQWSYVTCHCLLETHLFLPSTTLA